MAKLQDMFTQARRAQSGGGMGFLGKAKAETKARAAALVVEFPEVTAGSAEAAIKAGANGLLFNWDGEDTTQLEAIKSEVNTVFASNENLVVGLRLNGSLDALNRETLADLKEQHIQYVILPFDAPVRLLSLDSKDLEKVVTVPMRDGEMYPLLLRNLPSLDGIAAVQLDFGRLEDMGSLTIEQILPYQAVREAARFPAFFPVTGNLTEDDGYVLRALGVQAVVLTASTSIETTRTELQTVREVLEKVNQEEKDNQSPSIPLRKS